MPMNIQAIREASPVFRRPSKREEEDMAPTRSFARWYNEAPANLDDDIEPANGFFDGPLSLEDVLVLGEAREEILTETKMIPFVDAPYTDDAQLDFDFSSAVLNQND